ncbi:MAG: hypothetical protein GY953_49740, partial [bacterium]|nr:hypothetical protein [bacterium]
MPDLRGVEPALIGPITDLMAFYVDLWLAIKSCHLTGADGTRVVIGEDSIDFDITLAELDRPNEVATVVVKHVPPERSAVRLPAAWMREPV